MTYPPRKPFRPPSRARGGGRFHMSMFRFVLFVFFVATPAS